MPSAGAADQPQLPGRRLRQDQSRRLARRRRRSRRPAVGPRRGRGCAISSGWRSPSSRASCASAMRPGSGSWGSHRGITVHVTVPVAAGRGDRRLRRHQYRSGAGADLRRDGRRLRRSRRPPAARRRRCQLQRHRLGRHPRRRAVRSAPMPRSTARAISASPASRRADATISLVGSGDVALRATGTAAVQLTGSGGVTIAGGARCTIAKSGSGDVNCGTTEG